MAQIGNWNKKVDQNLDERDSWEEPLELWEHPDGPKCYYYKEDGPDGSGKYWIVWETDSGEDHRLTLESQRKDARRRCSTLRRKYSASPKNNRKEPIPTEDDE